MVDDEDDMHILISALISAENAGLRVVGEASGGQEAIEQVSALAPDAVVLDQRMPDMSGIDTARALLKDRPDLRVIPFSAFLDDSTVRAAREAGVRLYVARQWDARDVETERRWAAIPGVTGLVFSSFRHDNPGPIARGDWRF